MPLSTNISNYSDVKAIFDKVVAAGAPLNYATESAKAAYYWRLRAHTFRKLWRRGAGPSHYDRIMIRCDGQIVMLSFREVEGVLTNEAGEVIPVEITKDDYNLVDTDYLTPEDRELVESIKKDLI